MALGLATLREGHGNGGATGSLEGKHDDFAMILWCTVLMWGQSWEEMMTYEKIWEVKLIWVDIVHGTYLFWVVSSWICWCMRSINAYAVLLPSHLPSSWSSNLVNLASCHFDFLDALGKRKNAQTKPPSRKITSSAQSKDLQMFNILLAALCSTGARWARAFDLLRLRCQAEPWRYKKHFRIAKDEETVFRMDSYFHLS